jgi:hypothetical protein
MFRPTRQSGEQRKGVSYTLVPRPSRGKGATKGCMGLSFTRAPVSRLSRIPAPGPAAAEPHWVVRRLSLAPSRRQSERARRSPSLKPQQRTSTCA